MLFLVSFPGSRHEDAIPKKLLTRDKFFDYVSSLISENESFELMVFVFINEDFERYGRLRLLREYVQLVPRFQGLELGLPDKFGKISPFYKYYFFDGGSDCSFRLYYDIEN